MEKCRNKYEILGRAHTVSLKRFFSEKERYAFRKGVEHVLKRLDFDKHGNLC